MNRMLAGLVASVAAALVLGCGGSSSGSGGSGLTFSCNLSADSFCFDMSGPATLTSAQTGQIQSACTGSGGAFSTSAACPTANRVGTCTLTGATYTGGVPGVTVDERFYGPLFTASIAGTACTSAGGTWTAG